MVETFRLAPKFVLLENTIKAGGHPKREIYNALSSLNLEVCVFGEKLKGDFFIPYKPSFHLDFDVALDSTLFAFEHKGVNIWEVCRGNIGYDMPGFDLSNPSDDEKLQLKQLIARAVNFINTFEQVLSDNRPSAVVVWGGMFIEPVIMSILSKRHGIPVFATEFSFDKNRVHFDASGRIGNDFSFNSAWEKARGQSISPEQVKLVEQWISGNYQGKSKSQPVQPLSEKVTAFINASDRGPLLLLGQCYIDTVITFDSPTYATAEDAYFAVIDACVENDIPLIVKSHPGDKEVYKERLREKCSGNARVYYVGLDEDENVYHLMDACVAGVTINSQAGLEMIAKGKPVLTLGRAFYGEAGLASRLQSPEMLEKNIKQLMTDSDASPPDPNIYKDYLYRLLYVHLVDLSISSYATAKQIETKLLLDAPGLLPRSGGSSLTTQLEPPQLRVVIVHASPSWGGSGFYLQDLAMEMQGLGHEVMILAEGTCAPHDRGVRWRTLKFDGPLLSRGLREEIRDFGPNVVFEAGVRSKPMRAALELSQAHDAVLIVQGEDDEFVPFQQKYPGGNLAILDVLDKEIVSPADVTSMFRKVNLSHLAKVVADPYYDRWVDPLLRSILYHRADRFTAIWSPMLERLEGRFGTSGDLLPPIVRFSDFDLAPLPQAGRRQLLESLGLSENSLIYFVNGTIYRYSDEYEIFVKAMSLLQEKSDRPIALLVLGDLDVPEDTKFQYRSLGRLDNETYQQYIKLADVICAPGVPDTFNRYRLSSRLVKGMMMSKPIFTFKTGFAENLEDDKDGFFTHTKSAEEWAQVLQRTLSDEARALAGSRGSLLASRWFDAKAIAERLSESWLDLLATRGVTKPVISGILSETRTFDLLQDLYEKRVPFNLRKDASPLLQRKEIKHDRLNQFTLLTYGFTPFSENAHSPRPRYYAHRSISAIAITPNRKSDTVRLVLDFRKGKVDENSAIRIWTHAGEVEFTKKVRDKRLVLEFQASGSEFLIYQPIWYRGKNDEKIFFSVSDVIVKPRSTFDQSYAESISRGKEALKLKKDRDLVELAVKAGESGDYGQCVKHLEELLKAYPKKSLFLRALAEAQLQVGNPSAAVDALRRAHAVSAKKAAIDRRIREISRPSLVRRFLSGSPFPIAEIRKVLNPK